MTAPPIPSNPSNLDLLLALVRVEGKVDELGKDSADHEGRLRALEASRWPVRSVAIVVSICAVGLTAAGALFY